MLLSQAEIRSSIKKHGIRIDPPIEEDQWGPASINLRLGLRFTRFRKLNGIKVSIKDGLGDLGDLNLWSTQELKAENQFGHPETFCLEPNDFVLAETLEKVTIPSNLVGIIEGRSSYARVGISVHETAPWIWPGFRGPIMLEFRNSGPLRVELTPILERPCTMTFLRMSRKVPLSAVYGARATDAFQDQVHPLKQKKQRIKNARS